MGDKPINISKQQIIFRVCLETIFFALPLYVARPEKLLGCAQVSITAFMAAIELVEIASELITIASAEISLMMVIVLGLNIISMEVLIIPDIPLM